MIRNRGIVNGKSIVLALLLILTACGGRQTPITQLTPEDLFTQGMAHFEEGDWDDAILYLDRFTLVAGADPRVNDARWHVAQAHFNREEYVTSAAEFARLAADLGRADMADDARFMTCRAYEELSPDSQLDQEYTRGAIDHCRALLEWFPGSEHAEQARQIIDRMTSVLAEKVYEGGEWYFRRRAYDSALIYYGDVVELYPATVWAPRALKRLMDIYGPDRLDYPDELREAREKLLQEYPASPEARGGGTPS